MVLDAFGVAARGGLVDAQGKQETLDDLMALPAGRRQRSPAGVRNTPRYGRCTTQPSRTSRLSILATVGCATPRRAAIST